MTRADEEQAEAVEAAARAAAVDRAGSRTSRARRGTRRDRAEATTHRVRDPESEERAPRIDAEPLGARAAGPHSVGDRREWPGNAGGPPAVPGHLSERMASL